jgi:hypothetical protein
VNGTLLVAGIAEADRRGQSGQKYGNFRLG